MLVYGKDVYEEAHPLPQVENKNKKETLYNQHNQCDDLQQWASSGDV